MDISTRQVLKRTLETTNQHIELDNLVDYEEKWGDASVTHKAYSDYDVEKIPVFDPEKHEELKKENSPKMRHTHLAFDNSSTEFKEKMNNMVKFYINNNLWPASNFFKGPEKESEPELPVYDISGEITRIDAKYYEENNQKYYRLALHDISDYVYPHITLITTTDSKYKINPNNIVEGESTILEEQNKLTRILKSVNLIFEPNEENNYHIYGSVKTEDTEYSLDTNIPLYAVDEEDNPINPAEIDVYKPTEEEIELVNAIENALLTGVIPESETRFTLSTTSTTYTLTLNEGESLTNINIPDNGKTVKIDGNIKSGTTITYETIAKKTLYVTSESNEPIDITINCNGTVYASGNYDDIVLNGKSFTGTGSNFATVHGNIIIADDITGSATILANFVGDPNTIISNTEEAISITAKNENVNINLECPNSTVTVDGVYDKVVANVSDNTLKFTSLNTHINTLNLKHGNIFINNGKNVINDLVDEIVCDYDYTVNYNKATVLPNSPSACEYTLEQDKTGAITWGTFATGNTVINLNGHTIHNNGTDGRPTMNIRNKAIVDINGEGTVSSDNEYAVWGNGVNTIVNINGGYYRGTSHAVYSYAGLININSGEFILNGNDYDKDAKGHAKFLINCFDANFTAGTAQIIIKGGKYHNFDPADAYGEPTQPWSYVAEGFKSVCIDEENQIFEVIPE